VGLVEGSPNRHLGQGTASRRFFFRNAYLELAWVHDAKEARREPAARTRLWDRWSKRHEGACPFGIALRPEGEPAGVEQPFPTWSYHPSYLPPNLSIEVAPDTPLTEPDFFYLSFQHGRARLGQEPVQHSIPVRDITEVSVGLPGGMPHSAAARATRELGLVSFDQAEGYLLRLTFDQGSRGKRVDLRPKLPLEMHW